MLYGYDTNVLFLQHPVRQGIIRRATEFLNGLQELYKLREVEKRPIVLVSHGIGGVLVKAVSSL
jgi:hypothetical protein